MVKRYVSEDQKQLAKLNLKNQWKSPADDEKFIHVIYLYSFTLIAMINTESKSIPTES